MELESVLVSMGAEAVAALFVGASLAGLRKWYPSPVLRYWSIGWVVSAIASAAAILSLLAVTGSTTFPRGLATGLFVAGTLTHGVLQLEGVRRLRWGPLTRRQCAVVMGLVLTYAVGAVFLTPDAWTSGTRLLFRLVIPHLALGIAFILSGWYVERVTGAGGLGRQLLPVVLVLFGVQALFSGLISAGYVEVPTAFLVFTRLLVMLPVAFAVPLWFLEEERAALRLSQARERSVQERLGQSQRLEALGQLAAGIAHDFNNLLTVVGAHAEMIEMDPRGDSVAASAKEISEAKRRGASLVQRLLTFARRRPLEPVRLSLPEEVDRLESLLRPLIGDRTDLDIDHAAEDLPVRMAGEQLERVIMNLVLNARDAVGDRGRVRIRTGVVRVREPLVVAGVVVPPGRWAALTVEDDGRGIPEDVRGRIFDPFFSTKTREQGTGLGLATVYGVVEDARGRILVESEEGKGTTVTVLLPHPG